MDNGLKSFSRLLLIVLVCGLCLPALANCSLAEGVYQPSVPEFTAELVDSSYYVFPTYEIDPYTGKKVVDRQGYHEENKTLVVTIKNQAIRRRVYDGTKYYLAYTVAVKGHFEEKWETVTNVGDCTMKRYLSEGFPRPSDSDYTVLYFRANKYPEDGQLDVRVRAIIGYGTVIQVTDFVGLFPAGVHDEDGINFCVYGNWSEIQTITFNTNKKPAQPNFTITEGPDLFNIIFVGVLILIPLIACLGLLFYFQRKHSVD